MEGEQKNKENQPQETKYKFWIDEEGIVNMVVPKAMIEEETYKALRELKEILSDLKGKKRRILVNMNTKSFITSSNFRKRVAEILKDINDNPEIRAEKTAIFGGPIIVRTVGKFVLTAAGAIKTTKMFNTKEEALKWLRK